MKKAVLHIGTEKTGTTSIQRFLFDNLRALRNQGVLFPSSCDFLNNRNLVIYAKEIIPVGYLGLPTDLSTGKQKWDSNFVAVHEKQIKEFQAGYSGDSTVIYSSEHLQSRLKKTEELQRVYDLLSHLYDEISVLIYLRRQDLYALSAYHTSVKSGNSKIFNFDELPPNGAYYDYLGTLNLWSSVFGRENIQVKIFEKEKLHQGDVVKDFVHTTNIEHTNGLQFINRKENTSLSFEALQMLLSFNRQFPPGSANASGTVADLRKYIIDKLQGNEYGNDTWRPARESAQSFYRKFDDANKVLSKEWLSGDMFNNNFEMYPQESTYILNENNSFNTVFSLLNEFYQNNSAPKAA